MKTVPALGTSVSPSSGSVVTRFAQTLSAWLPGATPIASERNVRPVSLQIPRGQVHRVDQVDGIREIHVLDGVLWLTATPAAADVLVRSGERFSASTAWPIVFEAVKDASVLLVG